MNSPALHVTFESRIRNCLTHGKLESCIAIGAEADLALRELSDMLTSAREDITRLEVELTLKASPAPSGADGDTPSIN